MVTLATPDFCVIREIDLMSFYECPYCKKPAATFLIYCGFIFFGSYKRCKHCLKDVRLRIIPFFSFYIAVIVVFLFLGVLLPIGFPRIFGPLGGPFTLLIILILVGIQFFIPDILNYFLGIKLFEKKVKN